MRNSPGPKSTASSQGFGDGGWGQVLGALLLTGTFMGSIVMLIARWEANMSMASIGFVVVGIVLGIVLTDSGMNRSVPGLTTAFMALGAVPFLLPEAVPWELPAWALDAAEATGTTTAFFVVIGALGAATFRPYR